MLRPNRAAARHLAPGAGEEAGEPPAATARSIASQVDEGRRSSRISRDQRLRQRHAVAVTNDEEAGRGHCFALKPTESSTVFPSLCEWVNPRRRSSATVAALRKATM